MLHHSFNNWSHGALHAIIHSSGERIDIGHGIQLTNFVYLRPDAATTVRRAVGGSNPRRGRRFRGNAAEHRGEGCQNSAADLFPMMTDDELDELGKDIKKNGLRHPVVKWRVDGSLLDGRNRLEAIERAGLWETMENQTGAYPTNRRWPGATYEHGDPVAYVMSANVRRRHLTREQKREVIAALLKIAPERSDRQVAKDVGVDHKTVGAVRRYNEERGEIPPAEERVDTSGRSYSIAARAPYAIEVTRAKVVEERAAAEQRAVDEARHGAGNPYGIPPRDSRLRDPNVIQKPHPKGLAKKSGPWVTMCPCCGHDLYGLMGDSENETEFEAWMASASA
jgi:transposase-like protein